MFHPSCEGLRVPNFLFILVSIFANCFQFSGFSYQSCRASGTLHSLCVDFINNGLNVFLSTARVAYTCIHTCFMVAPMLEKMCFHWKSSIRAFLKKYAKNTELLVWFARRFKWGVGQKAPFRTTAAVRCLLSRHHFWCNIPIWPKERNGDNPEPPLINCTLKNTEHCSGTLMAATSFLLFAGLLVNTFQSILSSVAFGDNLRGEEKHLVNGGGETDVIK